MTIAYWCVLVAALMPYVATGIAKLGGERFNNRNPRAWLDRQQGFRARANSAQANSFEAFPFFAAAVVVATLTNAPQARIDGLAVLAARPQGWDRVSVDPIYRSLRIPHPRHRLVRCAPGLRGLIPHSGLRHHQASACSGSADT